MPHIKLQSRQARLGAALWKFVRVNGAHQKRSAAHACSSQVPSTSMAEYHVSGSLLGQPGRYVLRSAFGGAHSSFVVHGSEDCQVCGAPLVCGAWHR